MYVMPEFDAQIRVTAKTVAACTAKNAIGGRWASSSSRCSSVTRPFTPIRLSEPTAKSWTTKTISGKTFGCFVEWHYGIKTLGQTEITESV